MGNGHLAFPYGDVASVDHETPNHPLVENFVEIGDVDAYKDRLEARGLMVRLIDEAYARTLNIAQPDGDLFTVNETQRDLYGFHHKTP